MSRLRLDRRQFLTLPLALVLAPLARAAAGAEQRRATYEVDVSLLYSALRFQLAGTIDESVDRAAGRYGLTAVGRGTGISNRVESHGTLRGGRWAPTQTTSLFRVAGRESRSAVTYDYERRLIHYVFRGETFLLRRLRVVDDLVPFPASGHVDDAMSAMLNYADGLWPPAADGTLHTRVVRRRRREDEGPDDVEQVYRAELVPFVLRVESDRETGKPTALFDLTRFSSWARQGRPARIIFGTDRRPEVISTSLILGTSVTIRLTTVV